MDDLSKSAGLTSNSLRGEVTKVIYQSNAGDYAVLELTDALGVTHVVVGNIIGVAEGQNIEVSGRYESHKDFGRQLRVEHFHLSLPKTKLGITKFLSSGVVDGVGPKYAENIVNTFGEKTIDILDNHSARLCEVPGIGKKRAAVIVAAWREQANKRDTFIFLQGLGLSASFCQKLYDEYGDNTAQVVKDNPYRLADEIIGIGFLLADKLAMALGIERDALMRLAAGALYTMGQLAQNGHCCYPVSEFIEKSAATMDVGVERAKCGLEEALQQELLFVDSNMCYPKSLYQAECELPEHIFRIKSATKYAGEKFKKIELDPELDLSDEQILAVERLEETPITIITGGPGVGKTTVVGELVRKAKLAGLKTFLAAPTGRAAKRLSESTGLTAKTIHRMLSWEATTRSFNYNEHHPLQCDLLIVDEVSMLDLSLALSLFKAVKRGTSVVLVGDADQLPSVGPGNVFADLLQSNIFLVTHLSKIFRQGAGSRIILNAHKVNAGEEPELCSSGGKELTDFYWIEQENPERVTNIIERLQKERIPERFGFHPVRDIQVLTPMNRGQVGTVTLNERLQEVLNGEPKPQVKLGAVIFKSGDKVMQTSNNYDKNVFNGDLGRVGLIDTKKKELSVYFDNRLIKYDFSDLDQLSLAYAITVHKAQGSEFPAVIMPLLNQHYMLLQRNLLYTGMTRARKLLILVGSRQAVRMAVRNSRLEPRYTLLRKRLVAQAKG